MAWVNYLVGWCLEPSQPQRITSGLKTSFSLSPCYSIYKSLNHLKSIFLLNNNHPLSYFTKRNQCCTTHLIFDRTHQSLSKSKNHIQNFETPTRKYTSSCFGACLYSAGTQHGNLHQSPGTTSRVSYFILRAHTGKTRECFFGKKCR